jgi:MFS transporter, ACS family, glucarate transporter
MKYQHRVIGMLSLLALVTYLDRVCIAVAGPQMQDTLHISPEGWGWVTSVFFFSYAAFEIPTGALGDRIGPRRVLARVVLWWSAFTSLTGAVLSYPLLLLIRFCFGMGEAGAYPRSRSGIWSHSPAVTSCRLCRCWCSSAWESCCGRRLIRLETCSRNKRRDRCPWAWDSSGAAEAVD